VEAASVTERLSELVAGAIGRRIVSGRYPPGGTLPTEPRMQQEFGVSRTAVREAIRVLAGKGLTASRPKVGTLVRPTVDWNMLDADVLRWQIDQKPSVAFIEALFEMREIIEPAASARAAERASEAQLLSLGRAMDGIRDEVRGSPEHVRADVDFHMAILEGSQNPMLRSVGAMIESGLSITFELCWAAAMGEDAILEHRAIYDAIRARNPDAASAAMRRLLRHSRATVQDALRMRARE
jgi:GntR family galactonate operon transcriptional repressor